MNPFEIVNKEGEKKKFVRRSELGILIKEVALGAIRKDVRNMEFVSGKLRDDKDVVMEAVSKGQGGLRYASPRLRNDKEVVMKSIETDPESIFFASPRLKNDNECVVTSVLRNAELVTLETPVTEFDDELIFDLETKKNDLRAIVVINGMLSCGKSTTLKGFNLENWTIIKRDDVFKEVFTPVLFTAYENHFKTDFSNKTALKPDTLENQELLRTQPDKYLDDKQICRDKEANEVSQPLFEFTIGHMIRIVKYHFNKGRNVIVEGTFQYDNEFNLWLKELRNFPVMFIKFDCSKERILENIKVRNREQNTDHVCDPKNLDRQLKTVHYFKGDEKFYDAQFCTEILRGDEGFFFDPKEELPKRFQKKLQDWLKGRLFDKFQASTDDSSELLSPLAFEKMRIREGKKKKKKKNDDDDENKEGEDEVEGDE